MKAMIVVIGDDLNNRMRRVLPIKNKTPHLGCVVSSMNNIVAIVHGGGCCDGIKQSS
jgi:hypothetical protein